MNGIHPFVAAIVGSCVKRIPTEQLSGVRTGPCLSGILIQLIQLID
jgi:hypothetical protein